MVCRAASTVKGERPLHSFIPRIPSADDAAFAGAEEVDESRELGLRRHERLQLCGRLGELQAGPEEQPVGALDVRDLPGAEAAALQALAVDALGFRGRAGDQEVRRHVARHRGVVGEEGVRTDLAELVDRGVAGQDHPVAELHVAGECRAVRHDALAADDAVVRDVRVRHEQAVVTDRGHAAAARRAAVDRAELPEHVAVADLEPRRLTGVLAVLRGVADRGELEYARVAAERGRPLDDGMRPHLAARADADPGADDRERADLDARVDFGARIHDRPRVDQGLTSGATIIVADAATVPSTSATVSNFQIPRIARSSVAFSTRRSPGSTGLRNRALSMPTKKKRDFSSGTTPAVLNARMPAAWARASRMMTPGITGRPGKCPGKNGSFTVTFLIASMRLPGTHSITRSTSRNG